jgi:hypothetical protein
MPTEPGQDEERILVLDQTSRATRKTGSAKAVYVLLVDDHEIALSMAGNNQGKINANCRILLLALLLK